MGKDTTEQTEPTTQANLVPLQPDNVEQEDIEPFPSHIYPTIAKLTSNQRNILMALAENMVSEDIKTDGEIAVELGLNRRTIYEARQKPEFSVALTALCRDLVRGTADIALQNLMRLAQNDTKATEIWLRIAEIYQPTQRNVNLNASVARTLDTQGSISESKDELLTRMGELAWSTERVEEFAKTLPARFNELRAEGAF